jgi:diguanylate cyclase (GGDEF)-like protein
MRFVALAGVIVSLLLAGATVFSVAETASSRRGTSERVLEGALAGQAERLVGGERQMHAVVSQMFANPAVRALLAAGTHARRADLSEVRESLRAFERDALLPVSSACVDDSHGRPLACAPDGAPSLPPALQPQLASLAQASPGGAGTSPFLSPATLHPTVAIVAALGGSRGASGLVHFDIDIPGLQRSRILVAAVPGVRVQLGAYEHGRLTAAGAAPQPLAGAISRPGTLASVDHGPWSLIADGHRELAATVPLVVADRARELAVIATATAADPTLLNAWQPWTIALLALALALLIGSLAVLAASGRRLRRELRSDPLTGLRNRRALMEDLPRACAHASDRAPAYLWMYDLNGFKHYNDSFGHPAGDALLARLGARLARTVASAGAVYRLGGDEFCALITNPGADPLAGFEAARESLCERGGAFTVTASGGAVEIPREAAEPTLAMRLADQHMYRDKASTRGATAQLVTAVLHAALAQRHPELDEHSSEVACDVALLARTIGLDDDAIEMIVRAGDLHDVGKLGIPDEIISKAGPLNEHEWQFMRQHTVMGERIIAAAGPSLERIGPLVRASHERWDGHGYPDGLAGEEIPLGARIITICDSFRAMLSARPYKTAMTVEQALAELRRCAGSQFDPGLVDVFCAIVDTRSQAPAQAPAPASASASAPGGTSPS